MSQFTVRGKYQNRDGYRTFEKVIEAENENLAQEWTYSKLGSEHNLKRTQIVIEEVAR